MLSCLFSLILAGTISILSMPITEAFGPCSPSPCRGNCNGANGGVSVNPSIPRVCFSIQNPGGQISGGWIDVDMPEQGTFRASMCFDPPGCKITATPASGKTWATVRSCADLIMNCSDCSLD